MRSSSPSTGRLRNSAASDLDEPRSARRAAGRVRAALAVIAASIACAVSAGPAEAASPFLVTPEPAVAERSAAYRYANMSDAEAYAELDRRKIIYSRLATVSGVRAPVRLTGRLHGVWFHSSLPPDERVKSSFEILDARLALALDDFAAVLERHDIDEVIHFTMYRPNGPAPDGVHEQDEHVASRSSGKTVAQRRDGSRAGGKSKGPPELSTKGTGKKHRGERTRTAKQKGATSKTRAGKVAKREAEAKRPEPKISWAAPGTRHPAGLAIDVGGLRKRDGRWLSVGYHFQGRIGDKTCGAGARLPESPEARELRSIVCESADLGIFTYVLTPNYNAAHVDHFHMEIKPTVRWFLYH